MHRTLCVPRHAGVSPPQPSRAAEKNVPLSLIMTIFPGDNKHCEPMNAAMVEGWKIRGKACVQKQYTLRSRDSLRQYHTSG